MSAKLPSPSSTQKLVPVPAPNPVVNTALPNISGCPVVGNSPNNSAQSAARRASNVSFNSTGNSPPRIRRSSSRGSDNGLDSLTGLNSHGSNGRVKSAPLPPIREDNEDAKSNHSAARSNRSSGTGSNASAALIDSFEDLDQYVSRFNLKTSIPGMEEIQKEYGHNPKISALRRRFEAIFLILDAQMRMSKFPFVVMGPDGVVILTSPSIVDLFGYEAEELVGQNISTLMHEGLANMHDSILSNYCTKVSVGTTDSHSSVVNNTRPVTARHRNGHAVSIEITVKTITTDDIISPDSDLVPVAQTAAAGAGPVQPVAKKKEVVLFIGQLRDVSGEVQLRNTIEEFSTLQNIFPFPYIEANEHCRITKFNPAAAHAFGVSMERALGKNVTILMPRYIYNPVTGRRINRENHDKIVGNYISKIRSVGKASVSSKIVDNKTSHKAYRINTTDENSIEGETFDMELEVKMTLGSDGSIKFLAFARDCSSYMNAAEARNNVIMQTFPEPIARDLIAGRDVNGERDMSVLFCDIVGFTQYSSMLADTSALQVLSDLFSRFTDIKKRIHTFHPIKTNYDEFMAVTGLEQDERRNHTDDAIRAAIGMLKALDDYNRETNSQIDIRIGIDSGPCMCGILGSAGQKSFDIIGQTSVRASRAENTAKPGTIHITEEAYNRISPSSGLQLRFKPNGEVNFKNIGAAKTFISVPLP